MSTASGTRVSCTGNSFAPADASLGRGFTLIEVLVVVMIMGMLIGLVSSIARPDDRDRLHVEALRLAQLLDLAADESRLTGNAIAWTAESAAYRFWRYRERTGWLEVQDNDLLRARTLPKGMQVSDLRIEATRRQDAMRLEFSPYRPPLSFTIVMSIGNEHSTVSGSPVGNVRVLPGDGREDAAVALQ